MKMPIRIYFIDISLAIFLVFLFLFPPLLNSIYASQFLLQLIFSVGFITYYWVTGRPLMFNGYSIYLFVFFLVLTTATLLNTVFTGLNSASQMRDLIRLVSILLLIVFFTNLFKFGGEKVLLIFQKFFSTFALISSVVAVLWVLDKKYVLFLDNYIGNNKELETLNYWRFSGFLGNPNINAILFLQLIFFLRIKIWSFISNKLFKIFLISGCAINILLSSSRTVFATIIILIILTIIVKMISLFLTKKVKRVNLLSSALAAICAVIGFLFFVDVKFDIFYVIWRITKSFDYSSNDRFLILQNYFYFFVEHWNIFLLGTLSELDITGIKFTDNDYLFWIFKYGLFSLLILIITHVVAIFKAISILKKFPDDQDKSLAINSIYLFGSLPILAFFAPVWSSPQLIFLPIVVFTFLCFILRKKSKIMMDFEKIKIL